MQTGARAYVKGRYMRAYRSRHRGRRRLLLRLAAPLTGGSVFARRASRRRARSRLPDCAPSGSTAHVAGTATKQPRSSSSSDSRMTAATVRMVAARGTCRAGSPVPFPCLRMADLWLATTPRSSEGRHGYRSRRRPVVREKDNFERSRFLIVAAARETHDRRALARGSAVRSQAVASPRWRHAPRLGGLRF